MRVGIPDEELVRTAADSGSSLIVTSALGWRSDARFLLGRVAEKLPRSTRVPFLMVRNRTPFLEWGEGKRPLRIVVGDDLTPLSEPALEWVSVLRRAGPCDLVLAHVYLPTVEHRRLGLSFAREREVRAVLEKELQDRVDALVPGGARVRVESGHGRPTESLLDIAREEGADLFVLGTPRSARAVGSGTGR